MFLDENGVEPTNNRSERALRFGVLWRKRSHGTQSDKVNRWVERILSFKADLPHEVYAGISGIEKCYRCIFQRSNSKFGVGYRRLLAIPPEQL